MVILEYVFKHASVGGGLKKYHVCVAFSDKYMITQNLMFGVDFIVAGGGQSLISKKLSTTPIL